MPCGGRPCVSCFPVVPPSTDLKIPPPGPLDGAYVNQGGRRVFHSPAYTTRGFTGSIATSTAPTSSPPSTRVHVRPPSCDRKTPRSALAAYSFPIAATNTTFGSVGCTATLPM